MASVLKFDTWQTSAGVAVGTVLQVQHSRLQATKVGTSSTEAKFMEGSITTRAANSKIFVQLILAHSAYNADVDPCAAMGWATASSALTSGYTSLHGSNYSRQAISNLGSFWAQDTTDPGGGSWSGAYFVMARSYNHLHSPAVAAGTTVYYSVWVGSEGQAYWGGSYSGAGTDNGHDSTLTLWEIQA